MIGKVKIISTPAAKFDPTLEQSKKITTVKPKRDAKGKFTKGKPDRKTLRELLKEHKEYCQISDPDLALRTGLSLQTIRSYMAGLRKPGLVGAIKLCKELDITIDELAEVQEIWEAI